MLSKRVGYCVSPYITIQMRDRVIDRTDNEIDACIRQRVWEQLELPVRILVRYRTQELTFFQAREDTNVE